MPWKPRSYKGQEVWVRVDENGDPLLQNGSVEMKHDKNQNQTYRAKSENITPLPEDYHEEHPPGGNQIEIYTDGSSLDASQQGGPTGAGIVLRSREGYREISEPTGTGTNITSELDAIRIGLKAIKERTRPVRLYTDSEYSINALTEWIHNWRKNDWRTSSGKPVSHQDRIKEISALMEQFDDLEFEWVRGHDGEIFNERADNLAVRGAEEAKNK